MAYTKLTKIGDGYAVDGSDDSPTGGSVGARVTAAIIDSTHKVPSRRRTEGAATGADVQVSQLLNALDYYKADREALSGLNNEINDGGLDLWPGGTSFTTTGYTAANVRMDAIGDTMTVTRQSFTVGQTAVPGEPKYFIRAVVAMAAGAANLSDLNIRVPDVRTLAGQNAVLQFYGKADAGKNIAVQITQNFGNGGSPSTTVTVSVTTKTLTTGMVLYQIPVALPSISGKTLGTSGDHSLHILFYLSAGSNYNGSTNSLGQQSGTFEFHGFKLEKTEAANVSCATPFRRLPLAVTMGVLSRWFYKTYEPDTAPGTVTSAGQVNIATVADTTARVTPVDFRYPVPLARTPTVTYYDNGGNVGKLEVGAGAVLVETQGTPTNSSNALSSLTFYVSAITGSPLTAGNAYQIVGHIVADARL